MADPIKTTDFLFGVTWGPSYRNIIASIPTPTKTSGLPHCPFRVEMYDLDTGDVIRTMDLTCKVEGMLPHWTEELGQRWWVFLRLKGGNLFANNQNSMRFMATLYNPATKSGPAGFGYRSLMDYPGLIDHKKYFTTKAS